MTMPDAVIVAYGRSPCCKSRKGTYAKSGINVLDYTAQVVNGVLGQVPQLKPEMIDDFIFGTAATMNSLAMNAGRNVVHRAQLPDSVPAITINRFCSTGLQAMSLAANAIKAGEMDVVMVCGAEDMTHNFAPIDPNSFDPWLLKNRPDSIVPMGITAENVAKRYGVSRQDMDQMAVESHQKAAAAQQSGDLAKGIIPITLPDGTVVTEDEGIRPGTNLEALAALKPSFLPDGAVTAGNSSQTTDAAAAAVLMSAEKAAELGIRPIARFVQFAVGGCAPDEMGIGPVVAVPKVMARSGLTIDDMDVIELNEAFAAQAVYCIRELGLPKEKVNPWGGAMALGHPQGATGIFLSIKALDYLRTNGGKYALVTMCIGGGMGAAGILELL
jgi:acetyl-CoA acyltransferase